MRVSVINGPNLNLLGSRQPEIYGDWSLADIENACRLWAAAVNAKAETYQSNHEGDIIDRLHAARSEADAVVINPGAFSHYSYAIRDAIEAIEIPTVEVHLSNIKARETWRQHSVVAEVCESTIYGRGVDGYRDAIWHVAARARWPLHTIAYGSEPSQVGDLRLPATDGPYPVAILFHGGFWRDTDGRDVLDAAAIALTERGWATWNVTYRRVGSGGGWAPTMADASAALDALATFAADRNLDLDRVVAVGYEAGGQLAMSFGSGLSEPAVRKRRVHPAAVVGIAPISDLEAAFAENLGDGAIEAYLQETPDYARDRYRQLSPAGLVPIGVPVLVVHGDADTVVPVAMSRAFAGQAADAGDEVIYHELEGIGHEDLIRPGTMAFERVADELDLLSRRIAAAG